MTTHRKIKVTDTGEPFRARGFQESGQRRPPSTRETTREEMERDPARIKDAEEMAKWERTRDHNAINLAVCGKRESFMKHVPIRVGLGREKEIRGDSVWFRVEALSDLHEALGAPPLKLRPGRQGWAWHQLEVLEPWAITYSRQHGGKSLLALVEAKRAADVAAAKESAHAVQVMRSAQRLVAVMSAVPPKTPLLDEHETLGRTNPAAATKLWRERQREIRVEVSTVQAHQRAIARK